MENKKKMSEVLYDRYEYLAKKYANKIFSYSELSYEYEDLLQEFKIKIFTSIKSYGKRWEKYKLEGYAKPVPLRYYLEAACSNKTKDFMKYIARENYKVRMDDIEYDFGSDIDTCISPEENKFILNGINLLEGLTGINRVIFSLYLKGCTNKIISKVYNNSEPIKGVLYNDDDPFTPDEVIEMHKEFLLTKYGSELHREREIYRTYSHED